ncbi:hypothetical protein PIB30_039467 [Stylosanthes scabra]|uniref:Uncharacterized protein n=1 Tax=Stylosanthes scabra TaxID=79078 RepID=A0ABU6WEH0_9FABA|nr:hypothetical protein [Stylosanthes scabra]
MACDYWECIRINPPVKENNKHPFSLAILSEKLPKKFKYPVDMEPYNGSSDPKHHLDVFDNRMVLLNASDSINTRKHQKLLRPVWKFSEKLHHSEKASKDMPESLFDRVEAGRASDVANLFATIRQVNRIK